ncbi:MAG: AAA family ATPase [Tepidisphaera sp.]
MGNVIGTAYRLANGSKDFERGGKRGLIYPDGYPLPDGVGASWERPLFICEGASDTAALLTLGLQAVGVPSCGQGGKHLADLAKSLFVCFVTDTDAPGRRGSSDLANDIAANAAGIKIIDPPNGAKDARESVIAGADGSAFLTLAREATLWTPSDSFQSPTHVSERNESDLYQLVSIADLGPAVEPEWLWSGYLARGGITLLTGLWKAGKTTLMGYLLRDLYLGSGLASARLEGPTLYVSEEPSGLWSARRDKLGLNPKIHFVKRATFTRPTLVDWYRFVSQLVEDVRRLGAAFVVFDTLSSIWPVANENDAGEVMAAVTPLRELSEAGAAVLLIHHPKKGDGAEATASRGSGALTGFVDVILELRRSDPANESDRRRKLKAYGRYESIPPECVLELGDDGYHVLGDAPAVRQADILDHIYRLLPASPPGLTVEEVKVAWSSGVPPGATLLRELLERGYEEYRWSRTGSGNRGSPLRYHRRSVTVDSFPSPPSVGERDDSFPLTPTPGASGSSLTPGPNDSSSANDTR